MTMFRRSFAACRLIAFLLPFTFVWSWMACPLLCDEIINRHTQQEQSTISQLGKYCMNTFDSDSCPIKANVAYLETRQTVLTSLMANENTPSLPQHWTLFLPKSVYVSDVRQNSPPRSSSDPPLFLQFCNFRV